MSAPKSRSTIFPFAVDESVFCGRRGQTFIICTSSTIAGGPSRAKFGSEHTHASGSSEQRSIKTQRGNDNVRYGAKQRKGVLARTRAPLSSRRIRFCRKVSTRNGLGFANRQGGPECNGSYRFRLITSAW